MAGRRDSDSGQQPVVFLLPRLRGDGQRAALTARLRQAGVHVSPVLTDRTEVVLVSMTGEGVPAAEISRSVAVTSAAHIGVGGDPPSDREVVDAAAAGLNGWLPAQIPDGAMAAAVRDVAAGGTAWRRQDMAVLLRALQRLLSRRVLRRNGATVELTAREYEVLDLLADGESTVAIAAALNISSGTVRWYIASAVRRLGATDRIEAIDLFRGAGHQQAS